MRVLHIDVDTGKDGLPDMTVGIGHLTVEVEMLQPKVRRWHFWNTDRSYHGVWGRVLMVPFAAVRVEYFGPLPASGEI